MTSCHFADTPGLMELNESCYCFPIDRKAVDNHIVARSSNAQMGEMLAARKTYFASTAVFLSQSDVAAMTARISAIEAAVKTPAFQAEIFARGPNFAYDLQTKTQGVFMGYDFHMTEDGPRLIEINSNAGGAFIVNALEGAIGQTETQTQDKIGKMFVREWQAAGRTGRPKTIAIIDENPEAQFHYPDMCLAVDVLKRQGFDAVTADPSELQYTDGNLMFGDKKIDLVYNRLTDFDFTQIGAAPLVQAFADDKVVVSPGPRHHALYAEKRNLALLSDAAFISGLPIDDDARGALSHIPKTFIVTPENAEQLWTERKQYFFKPFAGFGSRGVYRGAKLTKKVWTNIIQGGYIAQKFIIPPKRAVSVKDQKIELKFDVRVYTYAGETLLLASRVYQGQATNLRTEGGGLAPVLVVGV